MRVLASCVLAATSLAFSAAAHADTVSFSSSTSATTYASAGVNAATFLYTNNLYGTPLAGSSFVSTSATGSFGVTGTVDFSNTINLLADEDYTGSLSFMADDYASVLVNGVSIYTGSYLNFGGVTNYNTPVTVDLLPSYFQAGDNTITFAVVNLSGVTAVDFSGSVDGTPTDGDTAVTPEPSSLMLLGTGILGLAGAVRRRFATA